MSEDLWIVNTNYTRNKVVCNSMKKHYSFTAWTVAMVLSANLHMMGFGQDVVEYFVKPF